MKKDIWFYVFVWSVGVFVLSLTSFFFGDSVVAEILLVSILPWSFVIFMICIITNEEDKSSQERFIEGVKQNIEHHDRTMEQKRKLERYRDYINLFKKNIKFRIGEVEKEAWDTELLPFGERVIVYTIYHDENCDIDGLTFKLDPYEMLYKGVSFQTLYHMAEVFGIEVPWKERSILEE